MLSQAIFSTLLYHSIFDYPLTIDEIHRYLISGTTDSLTTIKKAIVGLLRQKKILLKNKFVVLSSIIHHSSSMTALRLRRQKISAEKMIIARRASKTISIIPWIKMIAVTGALAMENAGKNDDIDLMVVTSGNRLWIVRPLAMILISIFFKRRKPLQQFSNLTIKQFSNSICLNLWLDESSLEIPFDQRNLYTAHELAQMKPIVNKDKTYEKMLSLNKWGEKFLANFWITIQQFNNLTINKQQFATNGLLDLLNIFLFRLQFTYMKPKMTNERVSLHSAFFHPGNRADTILKTYDRLCHRSF